MEKILKKIQKAVPLSKKEQVKFVKYGDEEQIREYLFKNPLCCDAEAALAERGDVGLLQFYMVHRRRFLCSDAQIALVKTKNVDLIRAFISVDVFDCETAEVEFVKFGNEELTGFYLEYQPYSLCEAAELELVKNGSAELLKTYFMEHFLWSSAQIELVKRGDAELIECYLCRYNFCAEAQEELKKMKAVA
jgi:hypothetical protein